MDSSELASLASGGWTNASAGHEGGGSDQSCIFRCKDEEVDATRYSILAYGESSFGIDVQLQVMTQTPFNLPAENGYGHVDHEEASSVVVDLCYKPPKSQMDDESLSDNGSVELAGVVQAGSKEATRDLELVDLTGEDADKYGDDMQYAPPVQFMGVTHPSSPNQCLLHQNDGMETLDGAEPFGMEQQAQLAPQTEAIEPVERGEFTASQPASYCDMEEYILYCAVREMRPSKFSNALARVSASSTDQLLNYLIKEGERYVPMLVLNLSREQASCLAFDGILNEIEISFDGWYEDESAEYCSIALSEASSQILADLLPSIDFLPPYDEDDVLCDRLPLFLLQDGRSRAMEEDVRNIRRTMCNWDSSVEGVSVRSVRLKTIGSSFNNFRELARANTSIVPHEADSDDPLPQTFRDVADYMASPYPLSVVSWNIANAEPSYSAPDRRQRAEQAPMLIKRECLRQGFLIQGDADIFKPDIIALQECPFRNFGTEVFEPDYKSMGQRESHSGYCDLLVRSDFSAETLDVFTPSVAALVTLPNKTRLAVASCHLSPFNEGAEERKEQCTELTRVLSETSSNIFMMGDFNMRQYEDFVVLSVGGRGWNDAWDRLKCPFDLKFTWNAAQNHFHSHRPGNMARYDRCYYKGDIIVKQMKLVGNQTVSGVEGDHLSDHFGIASLFEVDAANFDANLSCDSSFNPQDETPRMRGDGKCSRPAAAECQQETKRQEKKKRRRCEQEEATRHTLYFENKRRQRQ